MNSELERISRTARNAAQSKDWATVNVCANEILRHDGRSAEGHFLLGLGLKAAGRPLLASRSFERVLALDRQRYDAAIELASQYAALQRNAAALELLESHEPQLANSPRYLELAADVYSRIGLHERAWPLYRRANELQPGIDLFEANLAACSVFVGRIEEAERLYEGLLARHPAHQRNHYELARLRKAADFTHIEQMKHILHSVNLPPDKNIFLYYAIGKELEDLEQWDEAFAYYQRAGDAAAAVARYDVATDIAIIDTIIEVCDSDWLARAQAEPAAGKTPVFVVGLPRTGTTLTERILSSHSQVQSLGETLFLPMVLRRESGIESPDRMNPAMIRALAGKDMEAIARGYLEAVAYRLGTEPYFIDKYPENFNYLGFNAAAFPNARLVHLCRNPMDSCFAMYKQSFFRYAYTLDDLGRYYVAYERLARHWRALLGERLVEVEYEALVSDQEGQTRALLTKLGLEFEPACLEFDRNPAASTTASSAQIREKMHTRSVARWKHFAEPLQPLAAALQKAGIAID